MRLPRNEELAKAMREEGERFLARRKAERWAAFTDRELEVLDQALSMSGEDWPLPVADLNAQNALQEEIWEELERRQR